MLSLRSINQFYGQNHILWDVDLDLQPGTCTGIIGQPGMGKTTLVNCIMGHLPINSGSMIWQEDNGPPQDLLLQPVEKRASLGIGYVPQGRQIFSQMTIEENLQIALLAGAGMERHRAIPPMGLRSVSGALLSAPSAQRRAADWPATATGAGTCAGTATEAADSG